MVNLKVKERMPDLRKQRNGKQKPWTLEELHAGLEQFETEQGHYPTASEVDSYEYLPSARSVERRFGGLVALRQTLRLSGQTDFRSGEHSTRRAHIINERARRIEQAVYEYLTNRFGKEFVHREYFFVDDARTRSDFFVYSARDNFCVDVFYPSDRRNLIGCINMKLKKYEPGAMRQFPIIFLQMNDAISEEMLEGVVARKKKKFGTDQVLVGWGGFTRLCESQKPLRARRK